uniref:Adhesion G protein-coupled receptor L3-like protein n=1 Tax=Halisarca dujardinii TaxID=2583056 RepID=A0AA96MN25_HALDU|nr:adhesion G protein-coupled receptor L3-like protein [Halisarca dujardinii]
MEVNRALNGTKDSNLPVTVEEREVAVSVVEMLSTALRDSAQTNNSILPGDLDIATEVVSDFARLSENNELFNTVNVAEKTKIVKSVANVFSDVLDSTNNAAFGSSTEQSPAVSLLDSAEQLARSGFTSLSDVNSSTPTNDSQGQQGELVQRNIAIQTNRLSTSLLIETNFTFPKLSEESLNAFKNSDLVPLVKIPGDFVQALIQDTSPAATTSSPSTINAPPSFTASSVNEVNVVSFTLNNIQNHLSGELIEQEDDKKRRSSELASLVVSSQITEAKRTGIDSVDGPKVQLSFPLLSDVYDKVESTLAADERMEVRCAAWNFTGGPEGKGGWSFAGIEVVSYNRTAIECTSSHLTSFCVLVSVVPPKKTITDKVFSVITYIGCSISLVCLLLSIVFFLSLRKELIKRLHNFVHLNLCIALSLGLIVYIAGVEHAKTIQGACVFVSVLLHYFFLAAFSWMLCEAVMIYILLVKVFGANERKWIYMYLGLGWGIPVPIVVVSVAIRHKEYFIRDATETIFACWLPTKGGVIAAFIGPMLAILLINAVLLTLSLVSLAKSKCGRSKEVKMEDKESLQTAWQLTKATLILLPLMGFTWIIGLLAVGPGQDAVAIVFILLNTLQGVFIFILHVVRHEKVWSKIKSRLPSIRSEKSTLGSGHSSATKSTLQRSTLKRSIFGKFSTTSSQNTSTLKSQSEGVFKPLDNGDGESIKGSSDDNHEEIEMKEGTNGTNGHTSEEPVVVVTASSFGHSDVVVGTTGFSVGDATTDLPINGEQDQPFSEQTQDPSHKDYDSMHDVNADNGDSPTLPMTSSFGIH